MEKSGAVEILLVEDNPLDVELTIRALTKNNLANKIHVVGDGEEALDFIFGTGEYAERNVNNIPKVIFLDLKLPKVDGLEVLRRVKADEKTKIIPIVVLTSSTEERDRLESYNLGVNSFINKPVEFEKFAKAVVDLGMYWILVNKPPL